MRWVLIRFYCILSLFYIKPQLEPPLAFLVRYCILSLFYIKPQRNASKAARTLHCILSLFYIKPQQSFIEFLCCYIVSYLFSTSNHNTQLITKTPILLYLISFLHQTTTIWPVMILILNCILSLFYIKPQRRTW